MADSNVPQYPYMFPASEWSNKYSTMNSQNFPMYNYYGTPTDAMGNPIRSYNLATPAPVTGTTLNSTSSAMQPAINRAILGATLPGGPDPTGNRIKANILNRALSGDPNYSQWANNLGYGGGGQTTTSNQTTGGGSGAPPSGSNFGYLLALSNPGRTATPGNYNYPRNVSAQPDSASMDAIIASMLSGRMTPPPASPGIGGGSSGITYSPNMGFLNTLAALRAGSPGAK